MKKDLIIKYLILCLSLILVILLCLYLIRGKAIDQESKIAKELYSYLGNSNLNYCAGLDFYQEGEVKYDDIASTDRICKIVSMLNQDNYPKITLNKDKKEKLCKVNDSIIFGLDEDNSKCSITKIPKQDINELYTKVFNQEISDDEAFDLNEEIACYPVDNSYYCGKKTSLTISVGSSPSTYRSIKRINQKKNQIIIYDYFIKIVKDECYIAYTTSNINSRCTTKYQEQNNIDYKFLKKYGSLYKHTFIKNTNGTYSWVSSELVK